jgi:uncharacterized protein YggT (Ycf19 family)
LTAVNHRALIRAMTLIDFILNIAGLLLWLNWRASESPVKAPPGKSILSTLRPAGPPRPRYFSWAGLPALLFGRAFFYCEAGGPVRWNPRIPLGPITLVFRSDFFGRMLLFSCLSFALTLGIFYLWLLFLSWLNEQVPNDNPVQRLARTWLGSLDRWPRNLKLLAPLAGAMLGWLLISRWLIHINMVPMTSWGRLLAQGAIIGLEGYLTLRYLFVALLILYLLNSYVYLGEFPLWNFVDETAGRLLRPLAGLPLRAGKINFAPILAVGLVLLAAALAQRALSHLYHY